MSDWIARLSALAQAATPRVLVTVVAAKGSVPRAAGTRMIVTADAVEGTIGGGHLEYKSIEVARDLLAAGGARTLHRFPLGASLGQCCGGLAQLLFEPVHGSAAWLAALQAAQRDSVDCVLVTPIRGEADAGMLITASTVCGNLGSPEHEAQAISMARAALGETGGSRLAAIGDGDRAEYFVDVIRQPALRLVLFGAGHVGRALVRTLAPIPCRITWVDTRDDAFPVEVPDQVECVPTDAPEAEVAAAPAGACFLVMTHSHAQDEALAERILTRDDFAYFGLIGSLSKRRQFEQRLATRGMPRSRFARMVCPIGVAGIKGKEPEVIAIAVAAELLQVASQKHCERSEQQHSRCA